MLRLAAAPAGASPVEDAKGSGAGIALTASASGTAAGAPQPLGSHLLGADGERGSMRLSADLAFTSRAPAVGGLGAGRVWAAGRVLATLKKEFKDRVLCPGTCERGSPSFEELASLLPPPSHPALQDLIEIELQSGGETRASPKIKNGRSTYAASSWLQD